MTVFVDSSAWYAALDADDASHSAAVAHLNEEAALMTTDHVIVETWFLVARRLGTGLAEVFLDEAVDGGVAIEMVSRPDLEKARDIGTAFADQGFSLVDRTSFAVMERLGVARAVSFNNDFLVYRYGRDRKRSFEVLR